MLKIVAFKNYLYFWTESVQKLKDTFGDTVRELREAKKLTLREVAIKLGIDTSMLGKIEKNTRTPTLPIIKKIARLFDVSDKELRITYLSDLIVHQVVQEEDFAEEILLEAIKKITQIKEKRS
jgi:transcriptional regulator with XRE-family HTH domain